MPSAPRTACVLRSFLLLGGRLDLIRMLRPPLQANMAALRLERLLGRGLEVLTDDSELSPRVELHDVAGEHADVDDVADLACLAAAGGVEMHVDLLRTDGEPSAVPLDHVGDPDESRDELRRRALVHVG